MAFVLSGLGWLLIGGGLALIASVKLHTPTFFSDLSWLTFGRVRPAHVLTSIYGWGSLAGMGTLLWLTARLCQTRLPNPTLSLAGCVLWNTGLAGGVVAVLCGNSTGIEWLEMPPTWALIMATGMLPVTHAVLTMVARRRTSGVYVSLWYVLAAVVWFPLIFVTATLLIPTGNIAGIGQSVASWWFAHNLLGLWLVPIGLALIYYLVPRGAGRPLHSHALSLFGFWTFAVIYNWAGTHHLIGGPLPAWLISVGIVASVLMIVPVAAVALNCHFTLCGSYRRLRDNVPLRFVVVGATAYILVSGQGALQSLRSVNALTHFTHYTVAHAHLGVYAFFTLTLCGAIYYLLPEMTGYTRPTPLSVRLHFWIATSGIGLYWLSLTIGGIMQGLALQDVNVPFSEINGRTIPYLAARSLAAYLLVVAHLLFAWAVVHALWPRPARTPATQGATA